MRQKGYLPTGMKIERSLNNSMEKYDQWQKTIYWYQKTIVFELFQFLFMLEWFLACISRFSAHIPTSFSVFMPNICCLDKLDNKHYAYRLIMMWEYGQKNEKYWPGSIPAHIRIGKVLNVVIFDTNNCLLCHHFPMMKFIFHETKLIQEGF